MTLQLSMPQAAELQAGIDQQLLLRTRKVRTLAIKPLHIQNRKLYIRRIRIRLTLLAVEVKRSRAFSTASMSPLSMVD